MGDRGQVHIKDEGVWLYTHWSAHNLIETVKRAMAKKWRWDDPEYLARIIFDEMVGNQQGQETGFGISSKGPHGDEWRIITIDCASQIVSLSDNGALPSRFSFTDFIEWTTDN